MTSRKVISHFQSIDQISNKNMAITSLKNDKKKLNSKVNTLTKQLTEIEDKNAILKMNFKQEKNQENYFENLYKEEREKNLALQSQFKVI